MKAGPSNEKEAQRKYEKIKELRLQMEGMAFDKLLPKSNDPTTRQLLVQLERLDRFLEKYQEQCKSSTRAKIRQVFGRSGIPVSAKQLSKQLDTVMNDIINTSQQRGNHEILSPVAFQPDLALIPELRTAPSFDGTWILKLGKASFPLLDESEHVYCKNDTETVHNASSLLLVELGLTDNELCKWWRDHHLDKQCERTSVWNDMRAMARKMVFLLDFFDSVGNAETDEFQPIYECSAESRSIAIEIIMLVDRFPEKVEKIQPCVEFFIPILFALSECIRAAKHSQPNVSHVLLPAVLKLRSAVVRSGGKLVSANLGQDPPIVCDISAQGRSEIIESRLVRDSSDFDESVKQIGDCITAEAKEMAARKSLSQAFKRLQLDYIDLDETSSEFLGSGASGIVKKFFSLSNTEQYAVKIFNRCNEIADEARHHNRIIREAEIWTNIKTEQCRNINKLEGFSLVTDSPYPVLVMSICEQSLDSYWRTRRITTEEKLNLMHDVVIGLNFLHKNGIAHGDLRPENILVKNSRLPPRRIAVLADFGVADMMESSSYYRLSQSTNSQRGHEHYCAPELFKQKNSASPKVSKEADMYAFGCIFAVIVCELPLYTNLGKPLETLKKEGKPPVAKSLIAEPKLKYWFLLQNLWSTEPAERLKAEKVQSVIAEFIVNCRSSE